MKVRNALIVATALILFSLMMVWADKSGYVGDGSSQRAIQIAIGLVAIYFANLAPKTLERLSESCEPSPVQALQRFSGRALVLGGFGYVLAWAFVPLEYAAVTSITLLGTSLLLVLARCAWTLRGRERRPPAES